MGLSIRGYAAHRKSLGLVGGTPPAVKKALDAGRIHAEGDGSIDPERADREWSSNTNPEKQANGWKGASKDPRQAPAPAPGPPAPPPQERAAPKRDAPRTRAPTQGQSESEAPQEAPTAQSEVPTKGVDFNRARTYNEVFKAKLAELEFKERSGELVAVDAVKVGVSKTLTILRTHVMGIHSKCRLQSDIPPAVVALIENLCRSGLEQAAKALEGITDGEV